MGQINTAISELDNMTQQNASLVEETASASEEMSNQSHELLTLVERFKLDDASTELHVKRATDTQGAHAGNGRKVETMLQSKNNESTGPKGTPLFEKEKSEKKPAPKGSIEEVLLNDGFEEF